MTFASGFSSGFSSGFGNSFIEFRIEVDLDNDGVFQLSDDIRAYVIGFETEQGRDYASQLTGRAQAGRAVMHLLNTDGQFSSLNTSSPYYDQFLPGRRVRLSTVSPFSDVLWTGEIDSVEPSAGDIPTATLRASGVFMKLAGGQRKVNVAPLAYVMSDVAVDAILDAVNWPAEARQIDAGAVLLGRWFPLEGDALSMLREVVEETEGGFLCEGLDFDVIAESRYHREVNSTVSQATFSDDPAEPLSYLDPVQSDPLREIFNRFEVTVPNLVSNAETTLWTLSDAPVLAPGEVRTYFARMPSGAAYVEEWTAFEIGRDGTVSNGGTIVAGVPDNLGDVEITIWPFADTAKIRIENIDASSHEITGLSLDGITASEGDGFNLEAEDVDSQEKYTRGTPKTYVNASRWFSNAAYAQAWIDERLAFHKDLRPVLALGIPSGSSADYLEKAVTLRISDRITVNADRLRTKLGITDVDFYIENIAHRWSAQTGIFETSFLLSPAETPVALFTLDSSLLDGSDVLAY